MVFIAAAHFLPACAGALAAVLTGDLYPVVSALVDRSRHTHRYLASGIACHYPFQRCSPCHSAPGIADSWRQFCARCSMRAALLLALRCSSLRDSFLPTLSLLFTSTLR